MWCVCEFRDVLIACHASIKLSNDTFRSILNTDDAQFYTHLVFCDFDPRLIWERIKHDAKRKRNVMSLNEVEKWFHLEKNELLNFARRNLHIRIFIVSHELTLCNYIRDNVFTSLPNGIDAFFSNFPAILYRICIYCVCNNNIIYI